ncbi:class I SAM-dependent methyltransferase [Solilutibacter silvestris]|uniref:class I SAM-dependent methyltransferase n=1 Tax=Solilutibacter silvestris TaxID=1645665 RepID=UPI003D357DBF
MSDAKSENYHSTRLVSDRRRDVLWEVLSRHFQRYIPANATVLDFGAGYCGFINGIKAPNRYAFDQWEGIKEHVVPGVTPIFGPFSALTESVPPGSLDVIFCSNVFEHFASQELEHVLADLRALLKVGGRLLLLQPNYYYAYRNYFDDYTHKSVWTHVSLPDFLGVNGFETEVVKKAFLPLTVKSRLPVNPLLIEAYLISPIKPMAGQMFIVARKR